MVWLLRIPARKNLFQEREMKVKALILLMIFGLAGCSAFGQATPQALPTVVLEQGSAARSSPSLAGSGAVVASGVVAPAREAQIAFALAGKIASVEVTEGDRVEAGQTLVTLEGQESLEAAVSAAQFELLQAQQALEDLKTEAETAKIQAMQEIITYERAVRDAQYVLDNFTAPTNQAGLDTVEALNQMKQQLDQARLAFEPYKNKSSGDPVRERLKEDLDQAQADYNAAVRRLQYEYDLEVVNAKLAKALNDYAILKAGPDPAKLRLAEARQENAQRQLAATQAALDRLTLTAPFNGTIAKIDIHAGEWVIPGQPVLVLTDLDHLLVETTDLSERDIPQIAIGQTAMVFVEALNQDVAGHVIAISPLAETLGGDVVYKTTIELDELPPGLRAGMSIEAQFETAP
jgi:multidrug efflux pump subunit AcrA (membrane-fusion protein)